MIYSGVPRRSVILRKSLSVNIFKIQDLLLILQSLLDGTKKRALLMPNEVSDRGRNGGMVDTRDLKSLGR